MNERIRGFAEQAEAYYRANVLGASMYKTPPIKLMEQFAELIVLECAGLVKGQPHFDKMLDCATVIKQHFGVE